MGDEAVMNDDRAFWVWFSILCVACALAAFMATTLTVGIPNEILA